MPPTNIELQRRYAEAYNSRDIEALIALCDSSIESHSTFAAVGGAIYHGHDGMRGYQRDVEDAWGDQIRIEPEVYFDVGEHTLSFLVFHGRGRHSGAEVATPMALVTRWRNDLLVYLRGYVHTEDALRELGVTEDELEPIAP
jgi:hypothetical protein